MGVGVVLSHSGRMSLYVTGTFVVDGLSYVVERLAAHMGSPLAVHLGGFGAALADLANSASDAHAHPALLLVCFDHVNAAWVAELVRLVPARSAAPHALVIALLPHSGVVLFAQWAAAVHALAAPGVFVVDLTRALRDSAWRFPARFSSAPSEFVGDNPFGEAQETRLGVELYRAVHSCVLRNAAKLVVVDCDGTLWSGVCAEDGVAGVTFPPHIQRLHRWLVDRKNAGIVLAIASKNQVRLSGAHCLFSQLLP